MREDVIVIVGLIVVVSFGGVAYSVESEDVKAAPARPVSLVQTVSQLPGTGVPDAVVDFRPPETDPNLKWATPDPLVTNPAEDEGTPSIASAPNGQLFVAVDQFGTGRILIYDSIDGGQNWSWLSSFVHGSNSRNPALIYAENGADRWLVVVYEFVTSETARSLRAYRVDPDDPQNDYLFVGIDDSMVWTNPGTEIHPQITCDFPSLTTGIYFYVTYAKPSIDYYPVFFSRSTDRGETWSTPDNITGGSENTSFETRPEIAYSAHRGDVYVAFNKPGWTGSEWTQQVWVTNNTLWGIGGFWEAPVQVTPSARDDINPSVAAAWDSDTVMVVFTSVYNADDSDVQCSYSSDGGTVWSYTVSMPDWTFDKEDHVDLAVSQAASGRFHAVYRHNLPSPAGGDIWYQWADVSNPGGWSSALDVDEGSTVSGHYYYSRPTICVDLLRPPAEEAALSWTSYGGFYYGAYFDSAMLGNFDLIFADGFESADVSSWSLSSP